MRKVTFLFIFLLLFGCHAHDPHLKAPNRDFVSTDKTALVFGKIEIDHNLNNHNLLAPDTLLITSYNDTNKKFCCWDDKDFRVSSYYENIQKEEYFFFKISPGDYCLYAIGSKAPKLIGPTIRYDIKNSTLNFMSEDPKWLLSDERVIVFTGSPNFLHGYFFDIEQKPDPNLMHDSIIQFSVLPNTATYIGTIKVKLACCYFEKINIKKHFYSIKYSEKKGHEEVISGKLEVITNSIAVIDESEEAFKLFNKLYPNHKLITKKVATLYENRSGIKGDADNYIFIENGSSGSIEIYGSTVILYKENK